MPTTAYYCLLLPTTAYYCLLLRTTVYYCLLLPTTAYYCLLLPTTAYYCLATNVYYCVLLRTTAYYCLLLPTTASCIMFSPWSGSSSVLNAACNRHLPTLARQNLCILKSARTVPQVPVIALLISRQSCNNPPTAPQRSPNIA